MHRPHLEMPRPKKAAPIDLQILEAAIEWAGTSILIADARHDDVPIIYANEAFTRVTGYSREETVGRNCRFLQGTDRDQPARSEIRAALRENRSFRGEIRNYRKDGSMFWNELIMAPVFDARGNATHIVSVQNDVTDRKRELEQKQRGIETRELICSVVAHDIRNPLTAILLAIPRIVAALPGRDDPAVRAAGAIEASARQISRLTDDLLDFSRIDAGKIALVLDWVPVASIFSQSIRVLEALAVEKKIELGLSIEPPDLEARCDADRVVQVMSNLLGNAFKFTPHGSRIRVLARESAGHAVFEIHDEGPGIAPEALGRIFDRYFQHVPGKSAGGIGLGLAIAKGLVEAHGGSIRAESLPGRGSVFCFTLPEARSAEVRREPAA